ncbi:MAG: DNA-binding domain-containing protein [Bacteroidota bacterium]|nr:DNA-binding domain-containing protein [Bacteroidota bacterium]
MLTDQETHKIQSALASYCRNGDNPALPGIKEGRLKHYRRLVYNNVNASLRSAYPLACNFLKEETWEEVVNDYFMNYACQSPQIWQMPYEFYQYLTEKEHKLLKDYEFLAELLLMEWLEVELFMMEDIECEYSPEQNTEDDRLVLNPEHRLLALKYPVHLKKASSVKASDKGNFYLLMHRMPTVGSVVFTDVSVFFCRDVAKSVNRKLQ